MTDRFEALDIELPGATDKMLAEEIAVELRQMHDIEDTGVSQATRSPLDPATISVWLQLAPAVLAAAGGVMTLMVQIRDLLRRRGIKGAKITLADGTQISADEISIEELKVLQSRP